MTKPIILLLFLFWSISFNSQESVFLKAREKGNGILVERAGECFIICPFHVVDSFSGNILISDANRVVSQGVFVEAAEPDLAILRLVSGGSQQCNTIDVPTNFNSIINSISDGFIEYRDELGIANMMHVNIIAKDAVGLAVVPKINTDQIVKGMSGSSFYANYNGNKVLVGMLMQVEDDLKTGFIFQIDDTFNILGSFFEIEENKRIGVLIREKVSKNINSQVSNQLAKRLDYLKYKTVSIPDIQFIDLEFHNIFSGNYSKSVPKTFKGALDEIALGEISFSTSKNQFDMFVVHATLETNIYSARDFSFQTSIVVKGKGVGFTENNAKSKAIEDLIDEIKEN